MNAIRNTVAVLLALLSGVALTLGVCGSWVRDNVVDPNGFVAIVGPMSANNEVQQSFAKSAIQDVGADLPVPDWARGKVQDILTSQVHIVTDSEAYATIWNASMRDLHGKLLKGGVVTLEADIAPVWDSMAQPIDDILPFGLEVPVPKSTTITLAEVDASWFMHVVTLADSANIFIAVGILAAIGAVLLAGHRLFALGALGIALAGSGALGWFVMANHAAFLPSSVKDAKFVGPIASAFASRAREDLTPISLLAVGLGIACFLIAVLGAGSISAARMKRERAQGVERPMGERSIRYDAYDL